MDSTELAVIGAGPAGLTAAITAARAGVRVTLLDEYGRPGGQYLKGPSRAAPFMCATVTERKGRALLHELNGLDIDLRLATLVWGIEGQRLALHSSGGLGWLEAKVAIVATGARELVLPFPGWTLPSIMTLGGAQVLVKEHGVLPGRRALLAGSGPLLLPVASDLAQQGVEVVAVLEASHPRQWARHIPAAWGNWDRVREAWHYVRSLRRARVPYRLGWTVVRALGEAEIEAAVVARLDRQGHPIPGSEEMVEADALCLGFGLVPNIELTQLAGCAHDFDPARGGWVPRVDERLETAVSGLFAAGEAVGIGGAGAAMLQGRVVGLAAAHRLEHIREEELTQELAVMAPFRRRLERFGAMLSSLFTPPAGLGAIATDDTLICRCEEITAGEVREAVVRGAAGLDALKTWTQVGQGPCQGRTCGPLLARLVAHQTQRTMAEVGLFHIRPPLKPVPLAALALEGSA
jgi:NADPH-dependent 2,4-dienoyl-CoA reductase/sulfur reductase-like enzyme